CGDYCHLCQHWDETGAGGAVDGLFCLGPCGLGFGHRAFSLCECLLTLSWIKAGWGLSANAGLAAGVGELPVSQPDNAGGVAGLGVPAGRLAPAGLVAARLAAGSGVCRWRRQLLCLPLAAG